MFSFGKIIKTRGRNVTTTTATATRNDVHSKAINFEDALWITALPWGSIHVQSSVEFWRARARLSFAIRFFEFVFVFVSDKCEYRSGLGPDCFALDLFLLGFSLLWWFLPLRLRMDEKAILLPSIEYNNRTANRFLFRDGSIILEFR